MLAVVCAGISLLSLSTFSLLCSQFLPQICINILSRYRTSYSYVVSYHVATDKPHAQDGDKFWSIFCDNLQPIATRGKKARARYWSINTAATAVPLSAHPSPLVIITKLAAAILGGGLFGGGVLPAQYSACGSYPDFVICCASFSSIDISLRISCHVFKLNKLDFSSFFGGKIATKLTKSILVNTIYFYI